MHFSSLCEVIAAVHLSTYVTSPFEQRGGLMLVAPPGHLKTTAAEILSEFPRTLVLSDLTVKSTISMRDEFLGGNINTLVFSDYAKIHKRHNSVSANIEGIIMSLAGEGFRKPAFADQRVASLPARATIVGCVTNKFAEQHEEEWLDNGFYRRFIWCRYRVSNPEYLEDAIAQWRKAEFEGGFSSRVPTSRNISYNLTEDEVTRLRYDLRFTPDRKMALILAQKILCVLKWKFKNAEDSEKAMNIWKDFSVSLMKDGAVLRLEDAKAKMANKVKAVNNTQNAEKRLRTIARKITK
jgi:hypothetical protein